MPWYHKKYRPRKRPYRKRRYYKKRKRFGLKKQLRFKGSNNLILKQKVIRNFTIAAGSIMPDIRQNTFMVSALPQIATLASLFDSYKINGVSQKMTLLQVGDGLGGNNPSVQVATVKDYDGDTVGALSWNDLLQRPNCKVHNLVAGTTRNSTSTYITPKILNAIYNSAVSTAYSTPKGKQWIDMGNLSVPHYSIITGINVWENSTPGTPGNASAMVFQVETTYYLTLKSIK